MCDYLTIHLELASFPDMHSMLYTLAFRLEQRRCWFACLCFLLALPLLLILFSDICLSIANVLQAREKAVMTLTLIGKWSICGSWKWRMRPPCGCHNNHNNGGPFVSHGAREYSIPFLYIINDKINWCLFLPFRIWSHAHINTSNGTSILVLIIYSWHTHSVWPFQNISIIIILFSAVKIARTYSCTTVGEQLHSIDTQRDDSICACEQRHMWFGAACVCDEYILCGEKTHTQINVSCQLTW